MAAIRLAGMYGSRKSIRGVASGRGAALAALLFTWAGAHAATFTGTVFEDANYGGGAGRTRVASGGTVLSGVTVELYPAAGGAIVATTTTNASGVYTLTSGATAASMVVRVVNGSVRSARTGGAGCTTCVPVQTYRTDASSGTAVAVTNRVGGESVERFATPFDVLDDFRDLRADG